MRAVSPQLGRAGTGCHLPEWTHAYALWVAGLCHVHLGRPVEARADVATPLAIQRDFRDGICIALTIELLSLVATGSGHDEHAAILAGAAHSVWTRLGTTVSAFGPHLSAEARACGTTTDERLGTYRARAISVRAISVRDESVSLTEAVDLPSGPAAAAEPPTITAPMIIAGDVSAANAHSIQFSDEAFIGVKTSSTSLAVHQSRLTHAARGESVPS